VDAARARPSERRGDAAERRRGALGDGNRRELHERRPERDGSRRRLPGPLGARGRSGLEPSTYYWYRFKAGDEISPVGRTKTPPPYGAPLSSLKFAFASCADYQEGYFPAYRAIAEEEDLDIVFHLGDYIYEYAPDPSSTRVAKTPAPDDIFTYRDTYAEYKLDPGLQAAHAMHPWMVILAEAPAPGPACHVEVAEARRREAVGPGAGAGHGIGGELGAPVEVGRTGRSIFRDGHLDRFPVDGAAVEEKTSRGTPASRIASRRLSVPRTLVR
jgi:hypothetical protein